MNLPRVFKLTSSPSDNKRMKDVNGDRTGQMLYAHKISGSPRAMKHLKRTLGHVLKRSTGSLLVFNLWPCDYLIQSTDLSLDSVQTKMKIDFNNYRFLVHHFDAMGNVVMGDD